MHEHIGKTIKMLPDKLDPFCAGIEIEFTDGTSLVISTCGCCGLWEGEDQPDYSG